MEQLLLNLGHIAVMLWGILFTLITFIIFGVIALYIFLSVILGILYFIKFAYKKIFNKKKKDEIVCIMQYLLHKGLTMDFIKRQKNESEKEHKKRLQMYLDIVSEVENE